jgi:hypothetical protein
MTLILPASLAFSTPVFAWGGNTSGNGNVTSGKHNRVGGHGNVVSGCDHKVHGSGNVVSGCDNQVHGHGNVVSGNGNGESGQGNTPSTCKPMDEGSISVPVSTIVTGDSGSVHKLSSKHVDNGDYQVKVVAKNQDSVHPDSNIIVKSGSSKVVVKDVEAQAFHDKTASGTLHVSGGTVGIYVQLGADDVFSGGGSVELSKCVPQEQPPKQQPPQQQPPQQTPPATPAKPKQPSKPEQPSQPCAPSTSGKSGKSSGKSGQTCAPAQPKQPKQPKQAAKVLPNTGPGMLIAPAAGLASIGGYASRLLYLRRKSVR